MPSLRTAWVLLTTYYAYMLTYRVEIFLWMVASALPLIMMGIWIEAGASGSFPDVTAASAARYFLAVFIVRQVTVTWVLYEFEHHVLSGKLSPKLLHPIDPAFVFLATHLGEQLARLPFFLAVFALGLWLYPAALSDPADPSAWLLPSLSDVLAFVVAMYAAFAFRFLLQYTLAMLAFWFERVSAFEPLAYLPYLFLSGLLFPLEALPAGVAAALKWTPFPWLVLVPRDDPRRRRAAAGTGLRDDRGVAGGAVRGESIAVASGPEAVLGDGGVNAAAGPLK